MGEAGRKVLIAWKALTPIGIAASKRNDDDTKETFMVGLGRKLKYFAIRGGDVGGRGEGVASRAIA